MKKQRVSRGICLICALAVLMSVGAYAQNAGGAGAKAKECLTVSPGDLLEIRIPADPMLSRAYNVAPNGKLYLPVLEDVDLPPFDTQGCNGVACTSCQLEQMISRELSKFYRDTTVTVERVSGTAVMIEDAVYISGVVNAPGMYRYEQDMRLLDVLLKAVVSTENADLANVTITHKIMDGHVEKPRVLDISGLLSGADYNNSSKNVILEKGDYIVIPRKAEPAKVKFMALGQIRALGMHALPVGSTMLDVFAEVGGTTDKAGVGRAYLIRMKTMKEMQEKNKKCPAGQEFDLSKIDKTKIDKELKSAAPPAINASEKIDATLADLGVSDKEENKVCVFAIHVDFKAIIDKLDFSQNITLENGDVFFVPESSKMSIMKAISDFSVLSYFKEMLKANY
jgi:polysaccharide biosynthesis/export protein